MLLLCLLSIDTYNMTDVLYMYIQTAVNALSKLLLLFFMYVSYVSDVCICMYVSDIFICGPTAVKLLCVVCGGVECFFRVVVEDIICSTNIDYVV